MQTLSLILKLIGTYAAYTQATSVFCSRSQYGAPTHSSCVAAFKNLYTGDDKKRLFVEQQLRVELPQGNWKPISDPRPSESVQAIVQIPKFWSDGKHEPGPIQRAFMCMKYAEGSRLGDCNLALLSYTHGASKVAVSASRWSDIAQYGSQVISSCLRSNRQGGAVVIDSKLCRPHDMLLVDIPNFWLRNDRSWIDTRLVTLPLARRCSFRLGRESVHECNLSDRNRS